MQNTQIHEMLKLQANPANEDTHICCIGRPYDEELLELLLMLEAAEQKDEVWESFGREMTSGVNNLVEENIRGGGGDVMFDKVLSKEKRTGFWPQQEMDSEQVAF